MFIFRSIPSRSALSASRLGALNAAKLLAAAVVSLTLAAEAWAQGGQPIPPPAYFAGMPAFYDGNYQAALASFQLMQQQAVKNPLVAAGGGNWIDSICFQAMQGECFYQMGQNAKALACFENALSLYSTFPDWLASVQFSPVIRPASRGQIQLAPWYLSKRGATIGEYAASVPIMQGRINNNAQVQQGGVVQMAMAVPIYPQEIVRCTCLALRRWRELLGPTAARHPLTNTVLNALLRRPALPNHWSEAYVDVELGLAYAAAGKNDQAMKALQAGAIAAGQFDHQFTCIALLELGRLSLAGGNLPAAQTFFLEASASACNYSDLGVLEEALRYGSLTHMLENRPEMYAPLEMATSWARTEGLTQLQTSLLVLAAEHACAIERAQDAMALLARATVVCARTNIPLGKLGARLNYMKSLASYELADAASGEAALTAAMTYQRGGSLWLFHISLVDSMWQSNDLTDRSAMDLFNFVLRDPTPADWSTDPLESLTTLIVPHTLAFEHWFEVAITRKEHERALEIADLARRHRFLTTLEFGGRLLNLRWVLEGPEMMLDQDARQQRVALEGRYTGYVERSRRAKQLQLELRQAPLAPADKDAIQEQTAKLEELTRLSAEQEIILREIALRREPCNLLFPPLRSTKEVQESLPKGHGLLAFFSTSRHAYAFLMTKDKYGYWTVKASPRTLLSKVQSMLQKWGNFEQNKELKKEELADDGWKAPAKEILDALTAGSKAELGGGMFEELAIVPDGMLWYVPFEALQIADGDETKSLISKVRIRYSPTVGLAVGDPRKRRQGGNTAVVLGRLFPRDEADVSLNAFNDLSRVVPGAVAIQGKLPAPSAVYGSLFDRLVVYSEIASGDANPYAWSPVQLDHDKPGSALAHWFPLPWGGPDEIMLPGFRTSAEHAAKGLTPEQAANEMFLSLCGLMSTGARTVLISRWRTGGQSSYDLIREFVQELPEMTAADAWQRSIELVSHMPLDPAMEPRVKSDARQEPPLAENPFFWAGYLLADTGSLPHGSAEEEEPPAPLVIKPAPAPAGKKPDAVAEMKPDAKAKPEAGDDAVGGGLDLRRQPERAKPRRGRAADMPDPQAGNVEPAAQPPAEAQFGESQPDEEGAPGAKKKRAKNKADRKKPARGKQKLEG